MGEREVEGERRSDRRSWKRGTSSDYYIVMNVVKECGEKSVTNGAVGIVSRCKVRWYGDIEGHI